MISASYWFLTLVNSQNNQTVTSCIKVKTRFFNDQKGKKSQQNVSASTEIRAGLEFN